MTDDQPALVGIDDIRAAAAIRVVAEEARLVAEPSGALAAAALRFRAREAGIAALGGPVVGVVSGGNVDPDRFLTYLAAPVPPEA